VVVAINIKDIIIKKLLNNRTSRITREENAIKVLDGKKKKYEKQEVKDYGRS